MELDKKVKELAAWMERLKRERARYPVVLVIPDGIDKNWDDVFKAASDSVEGMYINYLQDIMNAESCPEIGAFEFSDMIRWLKSKTVKNGPLFITGVDPIITTWDERGRSAFFREYLNIEVPADYPIAMLSFLAKKYEADKLGNSCSIILNDKMHKIN